MPFIAGANAVRINSLCCKNYLPTLRYAPSVNREIKQENSNNTVDF